MKKRTVILLCVLVVVLAAGLLAIFGNACRDGFRACAERIGGDGSSKPDARITESAKRSAQKSYGTLDHDGSVAAGPTSENTPRVTLYDEVRGGPRPHAPAKQDEYTRPAPPIAVPPSGPGLDTKAELPSPRGQGRYTATQPAPADVPGPGKKKDLVDSWRPVESIDPPSNTPVFGVADPTKHGALTRGIYSGRLGYDKWGNVVGGRTSGQPGPARRTVRIPVLPGEELWIIAQPVVAQQPAPGDDTPGTGALMVKLPDREKEVPVPLKHTDVKAAISGYIATVEVTQQFHNPYDTKIEAVYVFPLPNNAAVNEFLMTVGERKIRGIIRERQEAERIYLEARRQGYVASLLTQERANVFTQRVANIEPGKQIDVCIKYFSTLAYCDGWYEFAFPMVVGPRFNPPGSSDGVGAVGRGARGVSGQSTEVQYLRPGERSGHDISLAVNIDAGVPIEALACSSHVVAQSQAAPERATVQLNRLDAIPNKDFVLRYKVAGNAVRSALMTHRDARGGFFTLMLYPPETLAALKRAPMEMVFVVDRSGSMSGKPIEQARAALERGLRQLQPDDTFQIIDFSVSASQFGPAPVAATEDNVRRGLDYAKSLNAGGGTMMIHGLRAALGFPHDPRRLRFICFLTDGYIGNEAEIIGETHRLLGDSRIFSFGVGNSVNRALLDDMARAGRGVAAYLALNDDAGRVMDLFFDRVSHPGLTDIAIDWGGMQVTDLYPERLPDLFVGRPIVLAGRFNGNGNGAVRVRGKVAGEMQELALNLPTDDLAARHPGIPCVWARTRIADLADRMTHEGNANLPTEIKQVALEYGLMSAYTAFLAVDSLTRTAGDGGVTVAVPVPVPDGVRYETTVQE